MPELNAIALPAGTVRTIEDLAVRAWPARLVQSLHGWRLAFGDGLTRRINSVQAVEWDDRAALAEAIEQVERFYALRALPARFRITAVSRPRTSMPASPRAATRSRRQRMCWSQRPRRCAVARPGIR